MKFPAASICAALGAVNGQAVDSTDNAPCAFEIPEGWMTCNFKSVKPVCCEIFKSGQLCDGLEGEAEEQCLEENMSEDLSAKLEAAGAEYQAFEETCPSMAQELENTETYARGQHASVAHGYAQLLESGAALPWLEMVSSCRSGLEECPWPCRPLSMRILWTGLV